MLLGFSHVVTGEETAADIERVEVDTFDNP